MEPWTQDFLWVYPQWQRNGTLPEPGGLLDQAGTFVDAMYCIQGVQAQFEEEERKREEEQERARARAARRR